MAPMPEQPETPGRSWSGEDRPGGPPWSARPGSPAFGAYAPASPGRTSPRLVAAWFLAALVGSAVLGLVGGLIWGEFAPRVLFEEIGAGTAEVVNAETRAFFGADVWFCGIAVVAGLLAGLLGHRFAVAPRAGGARALMVLALIIGAVAGTFVMLWLGERIGLSAYQHHLASSRTGTRFSSSLALGAKSALAFWPLFTAIVLLVAEWGNRTPSTPDPDDQP
jgi:hypothetical protein